MYKPYLIKLLLLASFVAFFSCDKDGKIEYIPFRSSSDGKWGMVGTDGKLLFEEEFKKEPTVAVNGRFMIETDKGWEVYSADKNPKLIGDGFLKIAHYFADVTPAVKKNEQICLINKDCEVVAKLDMAGNKPIVSCQRFRNGYAVITTDDDKTGVINTSGTIVVEPQYTNVFIISSNLFLAIHSDKNRKYAVSFFDGHGEKKYDDMVFGEGKKYKDFGPYSSTEEYLAVCNEDGEWGYIDYKGNVIVKPSSRIKGLFNGGYFNFLNGLETVRNDKFIFTDGDKWGVMDFKGEAIIKARYKSLLWANDNALVAVNSENQYRLIDLENEPIIDDYFEMMYSCDGKNVFIKEGNHDYTFMKMKGINNKIDGIPVIYDLSIDMDYDIATDYDGLACIEVNSQYIDLDGIVEKLGITKNSLMGYNLGMKPNDVVNTARKEDKEISGSPSDYTGSYFRQNKRFFGYSMDCDVNFNDGWDGMTVTQGYGNVVWSSEKPSSIEVEIEGDMIDEEKAKKLYSKIATKLKVNGKVVEDDGSSLVVRVDNSYGWGLRRNHDEVNVYLINKKSLDNYLGLNSGYDYPSQSSYSQPSSNANSSTQYVVINGVGVRFRFGPSLDDGYLMLSNGKTQSVPKGTKLPYLGETGNWYKVSYNNSEYYVSKDFSYLSY